MVFVLLMVAGAVRGQVDTIGFPGAWIGNWSGELEIYSPKGKEQAVPMELRIQPIGQSGAYTWQIIYGEDKEAGLRDYVLRTENPEVGRYMIDEQNSIAMDAILIHGKLYSRFEVMGNLLLSTAELVGEELHYEIISGKLEPLTVSGGEMNEEGEEMPEVKAYPVVVRQVGWLKRR